MLDFHLSKKSTKLNLLVCQFQQRKRIKYRPFPLLQSAFCLVFMSLFGWNQELVMFLSAFSPSFCNVGNLLLRTFHMEIGKWCMNLPSISLLGNWLTFPLKHFNYRVKAMSSFKFLFWVMLPTIIFIVILSPSHHVILNYWKLFIMFSLWINHLIRNHNL